MGLMVHKYNIVFEKRAFVHWVVGEGVSSGEMSYIRSLMQALESDYKEN